MRSNYEVRGRTGRAVRKKSRGRERGSRYETCRSFRDGQRTCAVEDNRLESILDETVGGGGAVLRWRLLGGGAVT